MVEEVVVVLLRLVQMAQALTVVLVELVQRLLLVVQVLLVRVAVQEDHSAQQRQVEMVAAGTHSKLVQPTLALVVVVAT